MFTQNEYVMMQVNRDAYDRANSEAKKMRMLKQAGLLQPGQLTRIACRAAGTVGRLLVGLGLRLVRVETSTRPAFSSSTD